MGLTSYQRVGSIVSEIECLNEKEKLSLIERLAEKSIELKFEDNEIENEESKFEVGEYYTFEDAIFKIVTLGKHTHMVVSLYRVSIDHLYAFYTVYANSMMSDEAREATDEEIKLFENAKYKRG